MDADDIAKGARPDAARLTDVILDSVADSVFTVDGDWCPAASR